MAHIVTRKLGVQAGDEIRAHRRVILRMVDSSRMFREFYPAVPTLIVIEPSPAGTGRSQ